MESGQRPDLKDAMNDVATTVEYLLDGELTVCKNKKYVLIYKWYTKTKPFRVTSNLLREVLLYAK